MLAGGVCGWGRNGSRVRGVGGSDGGSLLLLTSICIIWKVSSLIL